MPELSGNQPELSGTQPELNSSHRSKLSSGEPIVVDLLIIIFIVTTIMIIIDRSTVADQLLQLVEHVLCASGLERSRQTF